MREFKSFLNFELIGFKNLYSNLRNYFENFLISGKKMKP